MQHDLYNSTLTVVANAAATISTDTATAGIIIDTQGYESAVVNLFSGAYTDGSVVLSVNESDDSGMSGATAITGDFLIGTLGSVSAANTVDSCGLVVTKRYIQVTITSSGTTSGLVAGSNVVLGHANIAGK